MQSTAERFWTSFSRPTSFPATLRYGFLVVILALVCFNVSLKLRTYPHYFVRGQQAGMEWLHPEITRLDFNNYVVVSMLLLNHLAFGFAWSSRRVRVGLRVAALVGCVLGDLFVFTTPSPNNALQRTQAGGRAFSVSKP